MGDYQSFIFFYKKVLTIINKDDKLIHVFARRRNKYSNQINFLRKVEKDLDIIKSK